MITGRHKSKILTKYLLCECKCKFGGWKCNLGGIMINVDVSAKNVNFCEKDYIWNPFTCSCKNGKKLVSIMDDSVITYDEIIDTEATSDNKEEKKDSSKKIWRKKCNLWNIKFLYFTFFFIN